MNKTFISMSSHSYIKTLSWSPLGDDNQLKAKIWRERIFTGRNTKQHNRDRVRKKIQLQILQDKQRVSSTKNCTEKKKEGRMGISDSKCLKRCFPF